jgi:hypothetical protein
MGWHRLTATSVDSLCGPFRRRLAAVRLGFREGLPDSTGTPLDGRPPGGMLMGRLLVQVGHHDPVPTTVDDANPGSYGLNDRLASAIVSGGNCGIASAAVPLAVDDCGLPTADVGCVAGCLRTGRADKPSGRPDAATRP